MKTLVIYNTRTGATEQYAKWVAEMVGVPAKKFEEATEQELEECQKLYILSGTYGGQMPLADFLNERWQVLAGKNITAIAVGMVAKNHWWTKLSYKRVPKKIRDGIKFHKVIGWSENNEKTKAAVKKENLKDIIG